MSFEEGYAAAAGFIAQKKGNLAWVRWLKLAWSIERKEGNCYDEGYGAALAEVENKLKPKTEGVSTNDIRRW